MRGKPKKSPREKDLTSRYLTGGYETDDVDQADEFRARNKTLQQDKMAKTAAMRAEREAIEQALVRFRWNRRKTAEYLSVSYKTLLNKIKECGITDSGVA